MRPVKPFTRWTRDTETAFLIALELTGNVRLAAERVGRNLGTAYTKRQRDPDFAARWEAVVAEQQRAWADRAAQAAETRADSSAPGRFDGWSPIRRRAFLRALTETADVREACERVRISRRSAEKLRAKDPDFAQAWDAAIDRAAPMLEQIAWERAVEGWEEPIVVRGAVVGTRRRYSESLLRTLLARDATWRGAVSAREPGQAELRRRAHEAARAAGGGFFDSSTGEKTDAALRKAIEGLRKRLRAEAAARGDALPDSALLDGADAGVDPGRIRLQSLS